jgi:polysaccharide export outer membrane protein
MRHARLALLLLALPAMAGCVTNFPASQGPGLASSMGPVAYAPPPPPLVGGPVAAVPVAVVQPEGPIRSYTLDSGDRLRIVVFGQDGLTNSYAVDSAGNVTLPLVGPVRARGRTTTEVSAALASQLRQGFLREPHVAVEVEAYRPFFILGEVTFPGQYPYVPNMTVETAVAIAGGFSPRAFRRSVDVSRPVEGAALRTTVPVTTLLRPGDTVVVAERWF